MAEIYKLMLSQLQMVSSFMIPFLAMRFADICFGVILAIKDEAAKFEWKKLFQGLLWGLLIAVGIGFLVCGAVSLPALLDMYDITIVDTTTLEMMFDTLSIVAILTTTIVTYGKDAYTKLLKIFKLEKEVK